jgi:L-ascorbate metabolism protein UlaG (beta-lactamase superfamily)
MKSTKLATISLVVGLVVVALAAGYSPANAITPGQETAQEPAGPVLVQYIGHASFLITAPDGTRIITDPFDAIPNPVPSMPLPFPYGLAADVVTVSQAHPDHNNYTAVGGNPEVLSTVTMVNEKLVKVGMVDITGYRTWTGTTSPGFNTNFVYQIGDVKLVHLGESGPITDPRVTDPQSIIDALKGADVVFVPLNSLRMDDQIMPLLDSIDAHTIVPMHFSESPDVRYRRGATIEEFLAVVPPDMTVVTGVETLEVTPGMPYQIVVMSRTPFESN